MPCRTLFFFLIHCAVRPKVDMLREDGVELLLCCDSPNYFQVSGFTQICILLPTLSGDTLLLCLFPLKEINTNRICPLTRMFGCPINLVL